jgi:hypothetical protein
MRILLEDSDFLLFFSTEDIFTTGFLSLVPHANALLESI